MAVIDYEKLIASQMEVVKAEVSTLNTLLEAEITRRAIAEHPAADMLQFVYETDDQIGWWYVAEIWDADGNSLDADASLEDLNDLAMNICVDYTDGPWSPVGSWRPAFDLRLKKETT